MFFETRCICSRRDVLQGCIHFTNIVQFILRIHGENFLIKGIIGLIGGKNYTKLRCVDDAVFVSDEVEEGELQTMITRLGEICTECGMEVSVKNTKTMSFSKSGNMPLVITWYSPERSLTI